MFENFVHGPLFGEKSVQGGGRGRGGQITYSPNIPGVSADMSVCMSVCLSVHLSLYLSVFLSICVYVCKCICRCVCMYIFVCMYLCIYVHIWCLTVASLSISVALRSNEFCISRKFFRNTYKYCLTLNRNALNSLHVLTIYQRFP